MKKEIIIRCATAMTVSMHYISDDPTKASLLHRQKSCTGFQLYPPPQARKILIVVNHGGLPAMIWSKLLTAACRHTRQEIDQHLLLEGLR